MKRNTTERPHPRRMQAHTRGKNARRRNRTNGLTTDSQDNPFAGTTPAVWFKNQETKGVKLPRPPFTADAAFTRPNTGVRWLQVVDGLHGHRTGHRGLARTRRGQQSHVKTPMGSTQEEPAGEQASHSVPQVGPQKRTRTGPNGGDKHHTRVQCGQIGGATGSGRTGNATTTRWRAGQ